MIKNRRKNNMQLSMLYNLEHVKYSSQLCSIYLTKPSYLLGLIFCVLSDLIEPE